MSGSSDVVVKVIRCTARSSGGGQGLVRIEGPTGLTEESITRHIKSIDPDNEIRFLESGGGRFLATVDLPSCQACGVLSDSGCILDSAISRPDGGLQWNVIVPNDAALTSLVSGLREIGTSVVIESVSILRTARELTTEQEKVLQTAFDLGYYDMPKRIKLDDLARRLDMPKASLEVMLRRAQRKIVASHLGDA